MALAVLATIAALVLVAGVQQSAPILVALSIGVAFLAMQSVHRIGFRFTETNDEIARRAQKLEELVDHASRQIVVVSGMLFHEVYNHHLVLGAFERAAHRKVDVVIYYTRETVDPETKPFLALAAKHEWSIKRLTSDLPHVIIVDQTHVREELCSSSDDAETKLALIRYDVPKLARQIYRRVVDAAVRDQIFEADGVGRITSAVG